MLGNQPKILLFSEKRRKVHKWRSVLNIFFSTLIQTESTSYGARWNVPPASHMKQSVRVIVCGGMTGRGLTKLNQLPTGQTLTSGHYMNQIVKKERRPWTSGDRSGGRFSKDPVTYRTRKVILKTMIRLPWKPALLICFRWKNRPNNCKVSKHETCSYWSYKEIFVTRKVSGLSRNGPQGTGGPIERKLFTSKKKMTYVLDGRVVSKGFTKGWLASEIQLRTSGE